MTVSHIPIVECGETLVDVQSLPELAAGPPPETPQSEPVYRLVRKSVYQLLLKVDRALPDGLHLRLYEGLRSTHLQATLFEQEKARVRSRQPGLTVAEVYLEASKLVSPVAERDGTPIVTPHLTGAAVDVEIVDAGGTVIDFGMRIADWSRVQPEVCLPSCVSLSRTAISNRRLLRNLMMAVGFADYPYEWWHFSYGDQNWAHQTGRSHAIYGGCTPVMIAAATRAD